MQFLADESCDFAVVRALRAAGHAVTAVGEVAAGASDEKVIATAIREGAVLLTADKDFGQLVFAERRATGGVSGGASAGRLPPGGAARGEAGRQLRRNSAGSYPGRPQAPRGRVSDSSSEVRYAEGPLSIRQGAPQLPLDSRLSAFARHDRVLGRGTPQLVGKPVFQQNCDASPLAIPGNVPTLYAGRRHGRCRVEEVGLAAGQSPLSVLWRRN